MLSPNRRAQSPSRSRNLCSQVRRATVTTTVATKYRYSTPRRWRGKRDGAGVWSKRKLDAWARLQAGPSVHLRVSGLSEQTNARETALGIRVGIGIAADIGTGPGLRRRVEPPHCASTRLFGESAQGKAGDKSRNNDKSDSRRFTFPCFGLVGSFSVVRGRGRGASGLSGEAETGKETSSLARAIEAVLALQHREWIPCQRMWPAKLRDRATERLFAFARRRK